MFVVVVMVLRHEVNETKKTVIFLPALAYEHRYDQATKYYHPCQSRLRSKE
jgi:hypothetical protein